MNMSQRRSSRLLRQVGLGLGATVLAVVAVPVEAHAEAPVTYATFTFSGAVRGTLRIVNDCGESIAKTDQWQWNNTPLKGSKATTWTIQMEVPKAGTYSKHSEFVAKNAYTLPPVEITLTANAANSSYDWASDGGKITTTATSGKMKITEVPYKPAPGSAKGTVHITGTWGC
jgi:hypothetical protein